MVFREGVAGGNGPRRWEGKTRSRLERGGDLLRQKKRETPPGKGLQRLMLWALENKLYPAVELCPLKSFLSIRKGIWDQICTIACAILFAFNKSFSSVPRAKMTAV